MGIVTFVSGSRARLAGASWRADYLTEHSKLFECAGLSFDSSLACGCNRERHSNAGIWVLDRPSHEGRKQFVGWMVGEVISDLPRRALIGWVVQHLVHGIRHGLRGCSARFHEHARAGALDG